MLKADQHRILLLISVPPPYGGGELLGSFLNDFFRCNPLYKVFAYSRRNSSKSIQGKTTLYNLFCGFSLILKSISLIIIYRPRVIYLSLPKTFIPFFRTAIIVLFAKLSSAVVLGELPGADFPFLRQRGFKKSFGLSILKRIDSIRVLGSITSDYIAKMGIKTAIVIDNGVYVPPKQPEKKIPAQQACLTLVYIGSLEFSKGLFNSIKALKIAQQNHLSIHLHIYFHLDIP